MIGRIPIDKAEEYAARHLGWHDDVLQRLFWRVITKLDGAYRQWMSDQFDRARRHQKTRAKNSGGNERQSIQARRHIDG